MRTRLTKKKINGIFCWRLNSTDYLKAAVAKPQHNKCDKSGKNIGGCIGTIISSDTILTCAHCNDVRENVKQRFVVVGIYRNSDDNEYSNIQNRQT